MSNNLCTFFCVIVFALSALNTTIPDRKPQALSLVDNYSYKAQQRIPRKLVGTKWNSTDQTCWLNTISNSTVHLNSQENEKSCQDFMIYHGDYYWDQAKKSCMSYAYGIGSNEFGRNSSKFQCQVGPTNFIIIIVVPAVLVASTFCLLIVCSQNIKKCCIQCGCFNRENEEERIRRIEEEMSRRNKDEMSRRNEEERIRRIEEEMSRRNEDEMSRRNEDEMNWRIQAENFRIQAEISRRNEEEMNRRKQEEKSLRIQAERKQEQQQLELQKQLLVAFQSANKKPDLKKQSRDEKSGAKLVGEPSDSDSDSDDQN